MRLPTTLLTTALMLTPVLGRAHGAPPPPAHGGTMQEAKELWLELVVKENDVTVYVLDEARQPVPAAKISGSATVLVNGKSEKVDLTPSGENSVGGKLTAPAAGRIVATVSLAVNGKPVSARFMGAT